MAFGTLVREADTLLRNWVKTTAPSDGSRIPSERDLAKTLGVGHYALNRAMANLIAEGAVERKGYKLFFKAEKAHPKSSASFSCDLVVAQGSVHRSSYGKVAKELNIRLEAHYWASTEEAVSILQKLDTPSTECVIFDPPHGLPSSIWEPSITHLSLQGIPAICVGQPTLGSFSVMADYAKGLGLLFRHLLDLGHREIALATVSPRAPLSIEVLNEWESLCAKHELQATAARTFLQPNSRILPEDSQALARKFAKEWRKVTALILFTDHEYSIQHLLDELARQGKSVPQHLSLAFLGDSQPLRTANPPITAAAFDMSLTQETAFRLAQRAVRKKDAMGVPPPPYSVRIQPRLVLRSSTTPSTSRKIKSTETEKPSDTRDPQQITWVQFMGKDPDPETSLRRPYPEASKAGEDLFTPLDLTPYVNRPLNFRRGWLGDQPLKQFEPGRHMIHGVPFQVLGGTTRSDCGAIVFQSAVNSTGKAQKLPTSLSLPIDSKITAVYILHGCGYAKYLQTFGRYSFHHKKKVIGSVPLVTLGQPPPEVGSEQLAEACKKANIQDWWPDFPHLDFPGARMAPMIESETQDHGHRHVYLYTLEWINPSPQQVITHMEINMDPKQSTTLGLLSVCILHTKEKK